MGFTTWGKSHAEKIAIEKRRKARLEREARKRQLRKVNKIKRAGWALRDWW